MADGGAVIVARDGAGGRPDPVQLVLPPGGPCWTQQAEALSALIRAHVAALAWMRAATGAEIWETIAPSFPDADAAIYQRAVERYHRLGVWSSDATLPHASFDRLADLMQRGGLIQRVAPYEACCDDTLTRAVL